MSELTSFGPVAFGGILLIIIWKVIVKPQLDLARFDSQTMAKIAESFNASVHALEAITTRLERMTEENG